MQGNSKNLVCSGSHLLATAPETERSYNPFRDFEGLYIGKPEALKVPINDDPKSFLKKHLSEETFGKLVQFHDLLFKWNKKKQLVSNTTLDSLWLRHFLDSAQLYPLYPDKTRYKWLDIGTGGGFPGLVLACMASEFAPENEFFLVESNSYKAEFLRHVSLKLDLNVVVVRSRVEDLEPQKANIISARAVASLDSLLQWSGKHLVSQGMALFLKGRTVNRELSEALEKRNFSYTKIPSWTTRTGTVLVVKEIQ